MYKSARLPAESLSGWDIENCRTPCTRTSVAQSRITNVVSSKARSRSSKLSPDEGTW